MLRVLYSRFPRVAARIIPTNTTTPTASISRSSSLPPNIPTTHQSLSNSVAIPAPAVPPRRKRKIHMTYEILDRGYAHGRRKESQFVFTASYESSDDASKTDHKDDYCRKCQTTYYKRYAIPVPIDGEKLVKSAGHPQRLKYIEAHGEVRRVCMNCRNYFMTLMDDMKQAVGKNGNKDFKAGL